MLSEPLIRRCVQRQDHDRLLQALEQNGLPLPLLLKIRLADSPVAAAALGLRRLAELTYGPTPTSRAIAGQLLSAQGSDGAFDACPLATACAAAALARVAQEHQGGDRPVQAYADALEALAAMQQDDGSFAQATDRTPADRALTSVFILYLLADEQLFRQSVRFADLLSMLEQQAASFDAATDELWQMARLVLRPSRAAPLAPALAA